MDEIAQNIDITGFGYVLISYCLILLSSICTLSFIYTAIRTKGQCKQVYIALSILCVLFCYWIVDTFKLTTDWWSGDVFAKMHNESITLNLMTAWAIVGFPLVYPLVMLSSSSKDVIMVLYGLILVILYVILPIVILVGNWIVIKKNRKKYTTQISTTHNDKTKEGESLLEREDPQK